MLEILSRVLEPFSTAQEIGRGLSQIYGFVKQSGGYIQLGTRVHLCLPRARGHSPMTRSTRAGPPEPIGKRIVSLS